MAVLFIFQIFVLFRNISTANPVIDVVLAVAYSVQCSVLNDLRGEMTKWEERINKLVSEVKPFGWMDCFFPCLP